MRAHLLLLDAKPVARTGRILLDDVGAKVEELLQGQQVLVSLLAPLAEADQDEVLLQVALFLRKRVQACVLDRHGCLQAEALGALNLLRRELAVARALAEHGGSDRLLVRDERDRHERANAECAHVGRIDMRRRRRVVDHDSLTVIEHVEKEGALRSLAVLAPPQVFEVGGRGAVPTLAVFLVKGDLAQRRVNEPRHVVRDARERLVQVDGRGDGFAHVGDALELPRVRLRVLVQGSRLDADRELRGSRAKRLDLPPVRTALVRAVIADLQHPRRPPRLVAAARKEGADQVFVAPRLDWWPPTGRKTRIRSLCPPRSKISPASVNGVAVASCACSLSPTRHARTWPDTMPLL